MTVTSLRAGAALVNYSGSGIANTPPFTATTPAVMVTVRVSANDPSLASVAWILYATNSSILTSEGQVSGKVGTFVLYAYNLTPGTNYYLSVLSVGANWQITVNATT
ncbi:MAG: hypothetical protein LYZ69_02750 [Nitrososphaerales archaeon]|nr:hypothetical protein [Nitrososphaerales archaeon]